MITVWLVVSAFLYWPFRQWTATHKAPLLSALLWPLALVFIIGVLILGLLSKIFGGKPTDNPNINPTEIFVTEMNWIGEMQRQKVPDYFLERFFNSEPEKIKGVINYAKSRSYSKEEMYRLMYVTVLHEYIRQSFGDTIYGEIQNLSNDYYVDDLDFSEFGQYISKPFCDLVNYDDLHNLAQYLLNFLQIEINGGAFFDLQDGSIFYDFSDDFHSFVLSENDRNRNDRLLRSQTLPVRGEKPISLSEKYNLYGYDVEKIETMFKYVINQNDDFNVQAKIGMSVIQGVLFEYWYE